MDDLTSEKIEACEDANVEIAEVLRDFINIIGRVVRLPNEQKKEWIRTLDKVIYGYKDTEIECGCMSCAWKGLAEPTDLCPNCSDSLEIR